MQIGLKQLRYIVVIFGFSTSLAMFAETSPTGQLIPYKQALQDAATLSPQVKLQSLKVEKAKSKKDKAGSFLPSAPEIELSIERGNKRIAPTYFDSIPDQESMKSKSYELGINQQIDVSGQRSSAFEEAKQQLTIQEQTLRLEQMQARAELRDAYLNVSFHRHLTGHLSEHLKRFNRLKANFGAGYFDRKLGAYTFSALTMGIASLQSNYIESETAQKEAELKLRQLLQLEDDTKLSITIEIEDFVKIPLPVLTDEAALIEKAQSGLPMLLSQSQVLAAKAAEKTASRSMYPFAELFAATGRRNLGSFNQMSFQDNPAEKESFWRFGIRLPLGLLGPERHQSKIAKADREIAEEEARQLSSRLSLIVKQQMYIYTTQKANYELLHKVYTQSEPLNLALEAALASRRITYFEFWDEHERLHDIINRMAEARLKAAAALSQLEILTGEELE